MTTESYRLRTRCFRAPSRLALLIGLVASVVGAGVTRAADIQWVNNAGGNWADPGNWSPAQVPAVDDRALITLAGTYTVTISSNDVPTVDGITIGGAPGQQTLSLDTGASVSVIGSAQVGTTGIVRLAATAVFVTYGSIQNLGRIEADSAQVQADLGLNNIGVLELADSRIRGELTNRGATRTTGLVFFATFINASGATLDAFPGTSSPSGAAMDTLFNRGHIALKGSASLVAGDLLSNEAFAVLTLADSATTNSVQTINAGVIRVAVNAHLVGDYQQLSSGELEPHYSASTQSYCIIGQFATLDGTLSPVFEGGYVPPTGNLPLIFSTTSAGQFAIVNQAGTGGLQVRPLYLDHIYLQVLSEALAIFPLRGGDSGTLSTVISGSRLTSVVTARLRRAGESDIVADPVARDSVTGFVNARFDLTGRTRGFWDVVLDGPTGATETVAKAFSIEAAIQVPVRVEVFGRNRLRLGSGSTWAISLSNPGNVDAIGALQLVVPAGLGWELSVQRPGAPIASGVAGQFEQSTTLIVPDFVLPPGVSLTGLKVRLNAPAVAVTPDVTLQARWFQE